MHSYPEFCREMLTHPFADIYLTDYLSMLNNLLKVNRWGYLNYDWSELTDADSSLVHTRPYSDPCSRRLVWYKVGLFLRQSYSSLLAAEQNDSSGLLKIIPSVNNVMSKCDLLQGQKSLALILLLCTVRNLLIEMNNYYLGWDRLHNLTLIGTESYSACSYRHLCDSASFNGCCGCCRWIGKTFKSFFRKNW